MIVDKNKIKAVIFDWGGVCCAEGEPFASLDLQYTLNMTPDEIADKARQIYNNYYTGTYDKQAFWGEIIKHFGLVHAEKINPDSLSAAYLQSYSVYPEVLSAAKKLGDRYRVALLSNLTPEMRDHIVHTHGLENIFSVMVFSCDPDLRDMKPNARPYMMVSEKIQVPPQECLFIDNSVKNTEAAEALGMQTILFSSVEQLLSDIDVLYV